MKRYTLIVIVSVFDRRCCILNKMLMYIMWSVHRGNSKRVLVCIQTTSTRKFILLVLHKTWITPSSRDAKFKYSQTSLYELRTVCFVPGERKPRHQFSLNSTRLIRTPRLLTLLNFMVPSVPVYPGGGGGTLGISGWGCAAGTLEPLTYTRASSAEFCYPILE